MLVLTPAQLAKQWQGELREKIGLAFVCNDDAFQGFDAHNRIIASIVSSKNNE